MKILDVVTEHTGPFKTLMEVLKEIVPETNIEFRSDGKKYKSEKSEKDNKKKKKKKDESESEDESDEDNSETDKKKKDQSGMRIMAVDKSQTVLVNLKLEAKNFTKFKCTKNKIVLGVDFGSFYKCIKSMEKNDILSLYVVHDDKNTLRINLDNPEDKKESTFKLKLLDLDDKKVSVPEITFDAVITISSSEFHRVCREMIQLAEFVEIKCLSDKIIFTCKGDVAERETVFKSDAAGNASANGNWVSIRHANANGNEDAPQIVQGIYDLKHIVSFSKCSTLCPDIEIYMKNNYPLVIKYAVATLGRILLCLTPIKEDSTKNANYSDEDDLYDDDDDEDDEIEMVTKKKK